LTSFNCLSSLLERKVCNRYFLSAADILEVVEIVHDTLDDLWKQAEHEAYPEDRMIHLFNVTGSEWVVIH